MYLFFINHNLMLLIIFALKGHQQKHRAIPMAIGTMKKMRTLI